MTRIIYFDIAALALLLPLFVSIIIKRAYKTFLIFYKSKVIYNQGDFLWKQTNYFWGLF